MFSFQNNNKNEIINKKVVKVETMVKNIVNFEWRKPYTEYTIFFDPIIAYTTNHVSTHFVIYLVYLIIFNIF